MPARFPKNADGDFYTTGTSDVDGQWCGDCLACALPEHEAPDLLAPLTDDNHDTYFLRQPKTKEELEQAIAATEVCCVDAVRYGGKDKNILLRVDPALSDYIVSESGEVILNPTNIEIESNKNKWWEFWK